MLAKFLLFSISGIVFCSIHSCFPQGNSLSFCLLQPRTFPKLFSHYGNGRKHDCDFVRNTPSSLYIPILRPRCAAPSNGVMELHFLGFYTHRKICASSFSSSQLKILTTVWSFSFVSAYVYRLSLVPVDYISVLCFYNDKYSRVKIRMCVISWTWVKTVTVLKGQLR